MPTDLDSGALALLAHELRTPLTAMIGYADAMRAQAFGPLPAPYDDQAKTIYTAALHLLRLVDDLADTASAEAGTWNGARRPFNAPALARETLALLGPRAARGGIALNSRIDPAVGEILADRRAIGQILLNLLDNALKFTAPGGEVALAMERQGGELRIVVTDSGSAATGEGQAAARGQGLGLRLVRALCALHGGTFILDAPAIPGGDGARAVARLVVFAEP